MWPGAQKGSSGDARMLVSRKAFRAGLLAQQVDGARPTTAEADAWFDAALADTDEEGAAAGGGREGRVELVRTLRRAREMASVAEEELTQLQKRVKALQKAARAQQTTIHARLAEQAERVRASDESAQRVMAEQKAAASAASSAQVEARKRRLAEKAREKEAFAARVEARRSKDS